MNKISGCLIVVLVVDFFQHSFLEMFFFVEFLHSMNKINEEGSMYR